MVKTLEDWLLVKDKFTEFYNKNTVQSGDCILWTKTKPYTMGVGKPRQYLTVLINRKIVDVRKATHWLLKGWSSEKSTWITCGVMNCVNTSHVLLTDNKMIGTRKFKCKNGHDLTDDKNVLYVKRYLKSGESYYKPKCRMCEGKKKSGSEPKRDIRKLTSDTIETFDKDKCRYGHDLIYKTYKTGSTKRICPECKVVSRKKQYWKQKKVRVV